MLISFEPCTKGVGRHTYIEYTFTYVGVCFHIWGMVPEAYSRYPSLTKCGVAVHCVTPDKVPQKNISTPLPGKLQTNNRAELYALWLVVQTIGIVGKIDFLTDNKIVRDTILKGRNGGRLANHGDLWAEIFEQVNAKQLDVKVYWMPRHTGSQPKKMEKHWLG